MTEPTSHLPRFITLDEVLRLVPYSRVHLWRLERVGDFPKRVKLGANRIAWVESEIDAWIRERSDARDEGVQ